jgi:hypothetical protein
LKSEGEEERKPATRRRRKRVLEIKERLVV